MQVRVLLGVPNVRVAQLVEFSTDNRKVDGSNPSVNTSGSERCVHRRMLCLKTHMSGWHDVRAEKTPSETADAPCHDECTSAKVCVQHAAVVELEDTSGLSPAER